MKKSIHSPSRGDVHVNRPLTNMSVAFMQSAENFVASRVFANINSASRATCTTRIRGVSSTGS